MLRGKLVGVLFVCGWACGGGDSDPTGPNGPADASAETDPNCPTDCGTWCNEPRSCPNPGCLCPEPVGETACDDTTCAPSEVCVACNCGGPTTFECQPAPSECTDNRTCGCLEEHLCPDISTSCVDQSRNQILCDSELD